MFVSKKKYNELMSVHRKLLLGYNEVIKALYKTEHNREINKFNKKRKSVNYHKLLTERKKTIKKMQQTHETLRKEHLELKRAYIDLKESIKN